MSETKQRRKLLRQLLLAGGGERTQIQLVEALAEEGLSTTQSTVSRDLKHLGAERRIRPDGSHVYRLDPGPSAFPAGMILTIEHNEALIVVRTRVGRAPAVGLELDGLRLPEVIGTIAGDDTVLVIPKSVRKIAELARKLSELAELG